MHWWILLILVAVVLILWWALRKNAKATKMGSHEVEPHKAADLSAAVPTVESIAEVQADDLEIIEGIGPKIAAVLKEAGISTFAQLAEQEPSHLKEILEKAGLRLADPASWPEQARLAAEGNLEGLKLLQDQLKGGRITK